MFKGTDWKKMMEPGLVRASTIALLAAWAAATLWGWLYVDADVLRTSEGARQVVQLATNVFPWISNVSRLGPAAEKALFLHCALLFLSAPFVIASTAAWELGGNRWVELTSKSVTARSMRFIGCVGLVGLVALFYLSIKTPTNGIPRMDRLVFLNPISSVAVAPFPSYLIWSLLTTAIMSLVAGMRKRGAAC